MPDGILFRFANEEIIYLLRSLQISNFPGIIPEPFKRLPDAEKSLLMTEADHTLRARGLVHWRGETQREVDPLITKLLRDCAQPASTLFVDLLDANAGAKKYLYIFTSEATVEQCEPEPQIQQYLVIPEREALLQRLLTLLLPEPEKSFDNPALTLFGGQLSLTLWQEALRVSRENEGAATDMLARSLPRPAAAALANALHAFQRVGYLGRWAHTPASKQDRPEAALTVVAGREQLFLLWPEQPDSSSLTLLPASAQQLREHLARLIAPEP